MTKKLVLGIDPDSLTADVLSLMLLFLGPVGWVILYVLNEESKRV